MAKCSANLDSVFHALSHEVRRHAIAELGRGPATMTDLARSFDLAEPTILQHLRVLEGAELIRSNKIGRRRLYALNPRQLIEAEHWLDRRRQEWETRLSQLDDLLLELNRKENQP